MPLDLSSGQVFSSFGGDILGVTKQGGGSKMVSAIRSMEGYIVCCFLTVSGYRYLGDGGTDRREILHDMCPGCVFSPFGGGTPGIPQSKILAL